MHMTLRETNVANQMGSTKVNGSKIDNQRRSTFSESSPLRIIPVLIDISLFLFNKTLT